jgi:ribosomal protein L29
MSDTTAIKKVRKDVARILTAVRERELAGLS